MEQILRNIIEGVSNNYGKAFFDTIALKLHDSIGADFTFIARLDVDAYVSRTISLVAGGELVDNMEYSLTDTPCANVADDSTCLYPNQITHLFPDDQLLIDMGIEGYVGTPLHDSKGKVMGLTVALYKHPIQNIDFVETVFKIFSGRIAAEIERSEHEAELENKVHERTEHLESALADLKRTQAQLVHQEKLASLGGVVAGIAHEINTPLGIAKTGTSYHEDILKKLIKNFKEKTLTASAMETYMNQGAEVISTVMNNLERAIDLVQNFKHAAVDRIDSNCYEHNLKDIITRLTTTMSAEFHRNQIECLVNVDPGLKITSYASDLTQALSNLIMNASVHAYDHKQDNKLWIDAAKNGKGIQLTVTDNGVGVDKGIIDKIFEPFVTTKRYQGSTGLGMNIVHNLISKRLQGEIMLQLPAEGGTQWVINLPTAVNNVSAA